MLFAILVVPVLADRGALRAGQARRHLPARLRPGALHRRILPRARRAAGTFALGGLHMGQWLTVPMILGGIYLIATARSAAERVEPIAGERERRLTTAPPDLASRERLRRADRAIGAGRSRRRISWPRRTRIITRRAIRSARRAISSPRPRSARCSASWSALWLADLWQRAGGRTCALCRARAGARHAGRRRAARDGAAGLTPPVHFVETSPVLRAAQAERVPERDWHDDIETLPDDRAAADRRQRIFRCAADPPVRPHRRGLARAHGRSRPRRLRRCSGAPCQQDQV